MPGIKNKEMFSSIVERKMRNAWYGLMIYPCVCVCTCDAPNSAHGVKRGCHFYLFLYKLINFKACSFI